jgi:hypothetical protein
VFDLPFLGQLAATARARLEFGHDWLHSVERALIVRAQGNPLFLEQTRTRDAAYGAFGSARVIRIVESSTASTVCRTFASKATSRPAGRSIDSLPALARA